MTDFRPPLLEMRGIAKRFGAVRALAQVDLRVQAGSIHALVGENGAGKSTLMKVLSGVYPHGSYEGEILLDGQAQRFHSLRDSEGQGVVIVHQELALVPLLSVAENLFLGHERQRFGLVDRGAQLLEARALLERVGLQVAPDTLVQELGVGQQQLVEIAKALAKDVRLLILDEPTASLSESDSQRLLALLLQLKAQGVACILISHKLNEIAQVADCVTVLRDGSTVDHFEGGLAGAETRIIRSMVGRDLAERYPQRRRQCGEQLLAVEGWTVPHATRPGHNRLQDLSLQLHAGEIVGIAGLMGAGRTEFAMSLFGRSWGAAPSRGQVRIKGRAVSTASVPEAMAAGLAYVTEDRKHLGLVLEQSIAANTVLANLPGAARRGVLQPGREQQVAQGYRRQLGTRCASVQQPVGELSGGNQQKVLLARWLFAEPEVLIVDEPTRGIDVGAKFEIYTLLAELAEAGKGILMMSSELPELLGLCDRILVMHEGRFVAEFPAHAANQEQLMAAMVAAHA